jgi:hypothetical protein
VAVDEVVKLISPLVVVQLGVVDLNMMDLRGSPVGLFDQRPNLPTGLGLGRDFGGNVAEVGEGCCHGITR